jgi:RsiW-degrading membrane proteinase PrsW (M82 family)
MRIWQFILIVIAWAGAALISNYLYESFELGWAAAIPFYLLSISLPVLLLTWLGAGGIPVGSRNRFWGTLSIGMTAGPFLATLVEFFVYAGVLVAGIIALALNPDWMAIANRLTTQISGVTDIDKIVELLSPYIMNPVVIAIIFLVMAVLTPMIEEAIKPIAVWLNAGRLQNPAEGFALGAVSGAGFAIIEGLLASSSPSQGWGILLAARAGGSLMHILASGLMGWAIVSARKGKRLRLLWTYLLSVTIHGLWNSAAVVIELGTIQAYLKGASGSSTPLLSWIGVVFLGLLVIVILTVLILVNRRMRPPIPATLPVE